jgi:TonB family protein
LSSTLPPPYGVTPDLTDESPIAQSDLTGHGSSAHGLAATMPASSVAMAKALGLAATLPVGVKWAAELQPTFAKRSVQQSVLGHVIGVMVLVAALLWSPWVNHQRFNHQTTPTPTDMTFVLVKHPSTANLAKAQAKGEQAQLAGGKQNRLQAPAKPVVLPVLKPVPQVPQKALVTPVPLTPSQVVKATQPRAKTPPTPARVNPLIPTTPIDDPQEVTQRETPIQEVTTPASSLPMVSPPSTTISTAEPNTSPAPSESPGSEADPQLAVTQDQMMPYLKDLKSHLTSHWQPPRGENSQRVVVQFVIEADGRLSEVEIKESSGDAATDEAARKALEASSPVASIPTAWGVPRVPILFTFDYTVYGKSRLKNQK